MSVYESATKTTVESSTETESTITRHVEPESQAVVAGEPATYFRCETCRTEAMCEQDLRSEAHFEECDAR